MENVRDLTLAELVNRDSAIAGLFERYHLDFCCNGRRTLADAAASEGLNLDELIHEVETRLALPVDEVADRFEHMAPDRLADHIERKHHHHVRETIPVLTAHLTKVAFRHADRHPELHEILLLWQTLANDLNAHMDKEELILFPYIRRLADTKRTGLYQILPTVPILRRPVMVLEREHDHAGSLLREIRMVSLDFLPPADACSTYTLAFRELEAFEKELHTHIHLENNILFPMARTLEMSLLVTATD